MTMVGLPMTMFQVGVDMGDLEYIEGKVVAGDYFQVSGDIDAVNDTIEFIVPNLKTAFLIEAKIVANNTKDRRLIERNSSIILHDRYYCSDNIMTFEKTINIVDLKSSFKEIANEVIRGILFLFNCEDISSQTISGWQDKLLSRKLY